MRDGRDLAAGRARARCGAGVPAAVAAHAPARRGRGQRSASIIAASTSRPSFGADGPVGLYTIGVRAAAPLLAVALGVRPRDRDRAGDHPGRLRPRASPATTPASATPIVGERVPAVPGGARRRGPLPGHLPAARAGPGQAARARAAGPRAARHGRPPRLGHRDPGPGRAGSSPAPDPGAAVDALEVIEEEASRTLAEMRGDGRRLRDGRGARARPAARRGRHRAARRPASGAGRGSRSHLSGDLDDLRPSVGAAVYRIAQESITNAVRHARHATRIERPRRRRRRLRAPDRPRRRRRQLDRPALGRLRPGRA